jgi:hypothetical protein
VTINARVTRTSRCTSVSCTAAQRPAKRRNELRFLNSHSARARAHSRGRPISVPYLRSKRPLPYRTRQAWRMVATAMPRLPTQHPNSQKTCLPPYHTRPIILLSHISLTLYSVYRTVIAFIISAGHHIRTRSLSLQITEQKQKCPISGEHVGVRIPQHLDS